MEAHGSSDLTGIAIVMAAAVISGIGLRYLKQPAIVGYILAGILLGPSGAGLVKQSEEVSLLAELGVILLLFLIGMELSLKAFILVLRPATLVAAGQIAASLAICFGFGALLGWRPEESLLLGFIIAMSSTAVAMKMLEDIDELRSETGRITIGVLIAQDIAVVPMLILVSSFGGGEEALGIGILVKMVVAVGLLGLLIAVLGRRKGKLDIPFADAISGRVDLLTLATLAVCFVAASLSGIVGLSPAYGAFLAGLIIANSRLRGEAISVAEPIQSVLLVVFFLSIGLLIDIGYVWRNIGTVLAFVIGVVALKSVLNIWLLRRAGEPWERAFPAGLIMAQIGEFSFILAAAGLSTKVIGGDTYRLAIAVIAVSLLISPFWMNAVRRFHAATDRGISDYRAALQDAYAEELAGMNRGRAWAQRAMLLGGSLLRRRRGKPDDKPADPPPPADTPPSDPPPRA
ncbi:cation:proton antiporter [Ferrovibrio sp.]|uniref:cation:proton antiporter n=1 Tax=Ferrovibrio sp. TaxID=1917215 RepID=UPI0035143CA7